MFLNFVGETVIRDLIHCRWIHFNQRYVAHAYIVFSNASAFYGAVNIHHIDLSTLRMHIFFNLKRPVILARITGCEVMQLKCKVYS